MELTPIVVIGCGGSGGQVVLRLRKRLSSELRRQGWTSGIPDAWQLKWIDMGRMAQSYPRMGAALDPDDYLGIASSNSYKDTDTALVALAGDRRDRLVGWRPPPGLELCLAQGAGQMRAAGRSASLANSAEIKNFFRTSLDKSAAGGEELAQLGAFLGSAEEAVGQSGTEPIVFVVSSLVGGTGSGIHLDLVHMVRQCFPQLRDSVVNVLFSPDVFDSVKLRGGMAPNMSAALGELGSSLLAAGRSIEPLMRAAPESELSWPTLTFVVGKTPIGRGPAFATAGDCYQAVAETLMATMLDEQVVAGVTRRLTHLMPVASNDRLATRWSMLNQPASSGLPPIYGYLSSFGSARLSVGSARFGEWAVDRMSRAAFDFLNAGWRKRASELVGPAHFQPANDQQIVDLVVDREELAFLAACGIAAEERTGGKADLQAIEESTAVSELGLRAANRVCAATSDWLSRWGLSVTRGLVVRLMSRCRRGVAGMEAGQRRGELVVSSEFSSEVVMLRGETADRFLTRLVEALLEPLLASLVESGDSLKRLETSDELLSWPSGAEIGDQYQPSAVEFSLLGAEEWDETYRRLIGRSGAGSDDVARAMVTSGGFKHGPLTRRRVASSAIEVTAPDDWWSIGDGPLTVVVRLGLDDVRGRVRDWMFDLSHPLGQFLASGLSEYLAEPVDSDRLARFRMQLGRALMTANPRVHLDESSLSRVHSRTDHRIEIETQPFPFEVGHPAREIVEQMLPESGQQGQFRQHNTDGFESVLIYSFLDELVQPAAIRSLSGPISTAWNELLAREEEDWPGYIHTFNLCRRTRLLTESIPLPSMSIERIIRGYMLGRLLGLVTDPDQKSGIAVWNPNSGESEASRLPWPLLRHGAQPDLHHAAYRAELLPAVLEHFSMASLMAPSEKSLLDGYQALFEIGMNAVEHIGDWIDSGKLLLEGVSEPKLSAPDERGRQEEMVGALRSLELMLEGREDAGRALLGSDDYSDFVKIPYGWELIPWQRQEIKALAKIVGDVDTRDVYRFL